MPRLVLLPALAAALLSAACLPPDPSGDIDRCAAHVKRGEISSLSFEQLFLLQECGKTYLIDARHPWFFEQGRIPGAINLPADEALDEAISERMPVLKQASHEGRTLVVYCDGFGCKDARTVSRRLAAAGLDVELFGGGWKAWKKMGMATESTSQEHPDLSPPPAP